jgi:hypothetical protein
MTATGNMTTGGKVSFVPITGEMRRLSDGKLQLLDTSRGDDVTIHRVPARAEADLEADARTLLAR